MRRDAGSQYTPNSFEDFVMMNAQGLPLQLDAAPTTSGNELPSHGDWGMFGTDLYMNLFGSTYKFSGTLV